MDRPEVVNNLTNNTAVSRVAGIIEMVIMGFREILGFMVSYY